MDGGHHHYLSVDLLAGYFKFYRSYLEFIITNKDKLDDDFNVHMAAVDLDFILFNNEIKTIIARMLNPEIEHSTPWCID